MNQFPYFPLFVNDLLNDERVDVMTTTEFGAYLLLLCRAWHQIPVGSLPPDDAVLARWARLTAAEWQGVKPRVMACFRFRKGDGRYHQKRMQQVYADIVAGRKQRSENGRHAARLRWSKDNDLRTDAMQTQCAGHATSHSESKNKKSSMMDDGVVRELKRWGIEGVNVSRFARLGYSRLDIILAARHARALTDRKDGGAGLLASWLAKKKLPAECGLTPEIVVALVREGEVVGIDDLRVQGGLVGYTNGGLVVYQIGHSKPVLAIPRAELCASRLVLKEPERTETDEGATHAA